MNKRAKLAKISQGKVSDAEWEARVDLAAVYRLVAHYGWDDVIYNHSSMRVPGEPRHFLMKRHELLYTEVTASNLVKVSMDEDLDEKAGVNRPGFTLHGGVLAARPDVNCAMHVHTADRHGDRRLQAWLAHGVAAGDPLLQAPSAITPMKASPRISASASASTRPRAEPGDDPAQSRPAHASARARAKLSC